MTQASYRKLNLQGILFLVSCMVMQMWLIENKVHKPVKTLVG